MRPIHKDLRSQSGTSMVELLVSVVIAVIVLLTIGAISQVAIRSHNRCFNETEIYADVSYGLKLMQKRVRESMSVAVDTPGGSWTGSRVVIGNKTGNDSAFGLYQNTGTLDFVYVPDVTVEATREVITSVPVAETITLTPTLGTGSVEVQIQGEKSGVPFDLSTVIMRRLG